MVRGKALFRCSKCGHIYLAPDIELGATVFSYPQPCPKCGSKGYTLGIHGRIQRKMDSDKI